MSKKGQAHRRPAPGLALQDAGLPLVLRCRVDRAENARDDVAGTSTATDQAYGTRIDLAKVRRRYVAGN